MDTQSLTTLARLSLGLALCLAMHICEVSLILHFVDRHSSSKTIPMMARRMEAFKLMNSSWLRPLKRLNYSTSTLCNLSLISILCENSAKALGANAIIGLRLERKEAGSIIVVSFVICLQHSFDSSKRQDELSFFARSLPKAQLRTCLASTWSSSFQLSHCSSRE